MAGAGGSESEFFSRGVQTNRTQPRAFSPGAPLPSARAPDGMAADAQVAAAPKGASHVTAPTLALARRPPRRARRRRAPRARSRHPSSDAFFFLHLFSSSADGHHPSAVVAAKVGAKAEQRDGIARPGHSEIGKLAVWSVTSAKPGNGVELLRDDCLDTYWQSDGAQPHLVNVQFQKKVRLRELALYAKYALDESYTPSKISIRAGNSFHDLREIKVVDLEEPGGWMHVSLAKDDSGGGGGGGGGGGRRRRRRRRRRRMPARVLSSDRGVIEPPERKGHAREADEDIRTADGPDGVDGTRDILRDPGVWAVRHGEIDDSREHE